MAFTITVDEWSSVDDGGFEEGAKLAVQNLAGATVYTDTVPGAVAANGLEIEAGGVYEYPTRPAAVYLATASGSATVRVITLHPPL